MDSITQIHEKVLSYLLQRRAVDKSLFFVPRKINKNQRLEKGYWFIGNDRYIHVSFWNGMDWKEKIHNIGFVVHSDGTTKIELSAQDSKEKAKLLELVGNKVGGFEKRNTKNKWVRHYSGTDYIKNLGNFLEQVKPIIDTLIKKDKSRDILPLDDAFFNNYMEKIFEIRRHYDFGVYDDLFENSKGSNQKKGTRVKNTDEQLVSYSGRYIRRAIHNKIQQDVFDSLVERFGEGNVKMEENLIDIIINRGDQIELIEIKPYESVILCIREGLGQLLSYYHKHYFNEERVSLTIVGPNEPDNDEKKFIDFIKGTLQIRFDYVCSKTI